MAAAMAEDAEVEVVADLVATVAMEETVAMEADAAAGDAAAAVVVAAAAVVAAADKAKRLIQSMRSDLRKYSISCALTRPAFVPS